jgi:TrpR-related protein YerC/YecD
MKKELRQEQLDALWKAVSTLDTPEKCERFLYDLCTESELQAMGQRLHVASLLRKKVVYVNISQLTCASTATISRVNRALNYGQGGYELVLCEE